MDNTAKMGVERLAAWSTVTTGLVLLIMFLFSAHVVGLLDKKIFIPRRYDVRKIYKRKYR